MQVSDNRNVDANRRGPVRVNQISRAAIVLAMVLFAFSAAATNWYVDNAVSGGSKNGTSWANAWASIGTISWGSIKAGDTLYISGGTSSQVYSEFLNATGVNGTAGNLITISAGQDAGHNGQVIIDGTGLAYAVELGNYTRLTGNVNGQTNFAVRNVLDSSNGAINASGIYSYNAVGIVIDNVEVYSCNSGMTMLYPTPITISNCYVHDIRGDHGIDISGSTGGYDASVVHNCTVQLNNPEGGSTYGPDGIQGSSGVSVYNCNIYSVSGTVITTPSPQHQDGVQFIGNNWKIYNNIMTDLGNSCCEGEGNNGTAGYYMIYNNIMRLVVATPNVQRGIEWGPNGNSVTLLTDVYICNNTVVDLTGFYAINWGWTEDGFTIAPSIANFVVKNNIYYNSSPPYVAPVSSASISQFNFDYNAVYAGTQGGTTFSVDGGTPSQPHLQTGNVQFVSYTPENAANDYHLKSTDTVALGKGTNLSSLFTIDKDGNTRPATGAWNIGAYQSGSSGNTNPAISISPTSQSFGVVAIGGSTTQTFTVQNAGGGTLSGSASVSSPFSIVSGGSYSLTNGQTQSLTVKYSPTVAGTNNANITFTGGGGATVAITGSASAPLSGLTFAASAGTITAPFVLTSGYVSQPVQTGVPDGGTATYLFSITNAGNYVVQMLVDAPSDSENSLYVNIDGQPTDPYMTWQIPITTGFQNLTVSWQGNGTYSNSQFVPEVFNLTAGTHQLVIVGREMDTEFESISIVSYSTNSGSTNPAISITPASQSFGAIAVGTSSTNSFVVQNTGGGTLAGSASVSSPYSIVSGSSYSLSAGQSQTVTVQYSPTVAGTNNQTVTFTGGGGATGSATGTATAVMSGLIFQASAAAITSPFVLSGGSISQSVQTGVTNGGTATFTFTVTNAGNYVVQAMVNAPSDSENSFYVNIDAMPTDPYDTWQIPITSGFQNLVVSWQGTGAYNAPQFVPQIFALSAGTHQLIFVGREMDTQLQQVSILKIPSPPTGVHIVPGS